jgi:hypothetical protein
MALAATTTAMAETRSIPDAGLTRDDVVAWLRDQGLAGKITTDPLDHKIVSTAAAGTPFNVYFFDCDNDRCGSIQFEATWPTNGKIAATRVNDWNRQKRWARGYLNANQIYVEMDCDLTPGGSYELLNDELATWKKTVDSFKTFFSLK